MEAQKPGLSGVALELLCKDRGPFNVRPLAIPDGADADAYARGYAAGYNVGVQHMTEVIRVLAGAEAKRGQASPAGQVPPAKQPRREPLMRAIRKVINDADRPLTTKGVRERLRVRGHPKWSHPGVATTLSHLRATGVINAQPCSPGSTRRLWMKKNP